MKDRITVVIVAVALLLPLLVSLGCQTPQRRHTTVTKDIIRRVVCIYDTKPWLNLDRMGDRDPEGISYRIFLKTASGKSVLREGTFHIEMYGVTRGKDNKIQGMSLTYSQVLGVLYRMCKQGDISAKFVLQRPKEIEKMYRSTSAIGRRNMPGE